MLIEMHAHVLYGVDDGARSEEDMQRMLYAAAQGGVRHLVCTSHIEPGSKDFPLKLYRERLQEARNWCAENAPELELHPGSEIFYTPETPAMLAGGFVPTLDDSKLILVEFLPNDPRREIFDAMETLRGSGWQVVLAHVERYRALKSIKWIEKLRDEYGVLMQVNARSLLEERTGVLHKSRMKPLIAEGLVDFVSSDAHDSVERAFCMQYARHWIGKNFDKRTASRLCGGNFARAVGWKRSKETEE